MISPRNYVLPYLTKQEDIGNSVNTLNRSFKDLENFLITEKRTAENINNFAQNIDDIYDRMEHACSFLETNGNNLLQLYKTVALNKIKWLKPINLFYKEKFYDNVSLFSEEYINDIICKWVQSNYPVKINETSKPSYVDGQTAFVFYLKTLDKSQTFTYSNENVVYCQTKDVGVQVNCSTQAVGKTCISVCGCVDCTLTTHCKKTKPIDCVFKDRGLNLKALNRYLKINANYNGDDTYDTKIQVVKLIVKDCVWQIYGTLPDEIIEQINIEAIQIIPPKGLVTFEEENQISDLNGSEIFPFA